MISELMVSFNEEMKSFSENEIFEMGLFEVSMRMMGFEEVIDFELFKSLDFNEIRFRKNTEICGIFFEKLKSGSKMKIYYSDTGDKRKDLVKKVDSMLHGMEELLNILSAE